MLVGANMRDKHREREGQIKKLKNRDNALQQTIRDAQTVVQNAQEVSRGNVRKTVVFFEKRCKISRTKST